MIYETERGRMVYIIDTAPHTYEYYMAWPIMHMHAWRYSALVRRDMVPVREDVRGPGTGMIIGWTV
jgi:hypothetical protein